MIRTKSGTVSQVMRLNNDIKMLKGHIERLERAERRLKDQLRKKSECVKDAKGQMEEARSECVIAEENLEEKEQAMEALGREADRYRGWWLTEYYSLKVVLGLVPNKDDVEVIAASARGRFATYSEAVREQRTQVAAAANL
jgi:predicted RNase H-like nuclease (RuvC/YqgF family)